jgi:hypothetical protein
MWIPDLRSSATDDASHRRESAAPRPGNVPPLQNKKRRPELGGVLNGSAEVVENDPTSIL